MYKKNRNKQLAFEHFDQPLGLKLNPENRWVKKAETIPWDAIEERYASSSQAIVEFRQSHFGWHSDHCSFRSISDALIANW